MRKRAAAKAAKDIVRSAAKPKPSPRKAGSVIDTIVKNMTPKPEKGKGADNRKRVGVMGDDQKFLADPDEWISTGFPTLDHLFGGGLPVGRVVEFSGPEAAGKTAMSQCCMAQCQKQGGIVCYIDAERSCDRRRLRQLGVDLDRVIYVKPRYFEEATQKVMQFLDQARKLKDKVGGPSLVVFDSLAASIPKRVYESRLDDVDSMGAHHAACISGLCGKLYDEIDGSRAVALLINQEREKVDDASRFKKPHTPGGRHVKHAASIRARFTAQKMRRGKLVTGLLCHVGTVKSKLAIPFGKVDWVLDFREGPDFARSVLETLKQVRVLYKSKDKLRFRTDSTREIAGLDEWRDLWKTAPFRREIAKIIAGLPNDLTVSAASVLSDEGDDDENEIAEDE